MYFFQFGLSGNFEANLRTLRVERQITLRISVRNFNWKNNISMQFRGTQKNAISRAETYAFFSFLKRFVEKRILNGSLIWVWFRERNFQLWILRAKKFHILFRGCMGRRSLDPPPPYKKNLDDIFVSTKRVELVDPLLEWEFINH